MNAPMDAVGKARLNGWRRSRPGWPGHQFDEISAAMNQTRAGRTCWIQSPGPAFSCAPARGRLVIPLAADRRACVASRRLVDGAAGAEP